MARIPDSELARLKSEVSVEALARVRGVKLIRKGADLHGRCPFHEDRTPSLVITPEKNLWHCLGACQEGGTVIDWVQKAEGVSFRHAVELLRADLPKLSDSSTPIVRVSTKKKLPKLASSDAEGRDLLRRVVEHYHQTMKDEPAAREYLASRGLTHPELVSHFRLGYANRTLGYRLPDKGRQEGAALRGKLRDLGVLRKSGHEHLSGSLVVPLTDAAGQVVQLYGRKVRSDLRKGTALHLYLPGPQRGVLNRDGLGEEVILCESILDALTFWCAGIRNVTTTYGTSGLTEEMRQALQAAGTKRVLLAFDRDAAGEKAAERVAKELTALGMAAYRIQFPKGMDANEYAQKVTPAPKSLAAVVRAALWMGEGQPLPRPAGPSVPAERIVPETSEASEPPAPPEAAERETAEADPPAPATGEDRAAEEEGDEEPGTPDAPPEIPGAAHTEEGEEEDAGEVHQLVTAPPDPAPPPPPKLTPRGEDLWMELPAFSFRVRGLGRNTSPEVMKVNLLVTRAPGGDLSLAEAFHVDQLDLYVSRQRQAYATQAARELRVDEGEMKRRLGQLLLALELAQAEELTKLTEPKDDAPVMSDADRLEAEAFLRDPRLLSRILEDFETCGVVGEEVNKLASYLAAVSRKQERPLAIVVQSNSAAGKSSLMDAVLAFMPPEEQVCYSAMTGQSLFYMSGANLKHRILAIAEEEGAQRASYALKLLQSEGHLTIASTGKDPHTGRLTTEDYRVEGPVMIFLTTTATDVDEELMNRCLVLAVDEGAELTDQIHVRQRARRTKKGKKQEVAKAATLRRHRNAQRLLRPLWVVNPYAQRLTFPIHQTRFRRDHEKYLTLIETVAFLHQYQREVHVERLTGGEEIRSVQVTPADVAVANQLAHEILGRSVDELPPQTRSVLRVISGEVGRLAREERQERDAVRFTRRQVREWTGLTNNRVHVHLRRLEDLEYVLVHAGSRGKSLVYELVYEGDGQEGVPHFPGLVDMATLEAGSGYDANLSGVPGEYSPPIRPLFVANSPLIRPADGEPEAPEKHSLSTFLSSLEADSKTSLENARRGEAKDSPVIARRANGSRDPSASEE